MGGGAMTAVALAGGAVVAVGGLGGGLAFCVRQAPQSEISASSKPERIPKTAFAMAVPKSWLGSGDNRRVVLATVRAGLSAVLARARRASR